MLNFYGYGAKKAWIAPIVSDDSGSNTGPVYGAARRWYGFQSVNYTMNREEQTLTGDGGPIGTESELDSIQVTAEVGLTSPDVEGILFGAPAWHTSEGAKFAIDEDAGGNYVGLWVLTDKTGANGKQLVLFYPRIKFSQVQKNTAQRSFRTNSMNASAAFTKSKFEVFKDGVKQFKRLAVIENYENAEDVFPESTTVPELDGSQDDPVVLASVNDNIEILMNEELEPNTVNKYTVLLKKGGVLVDRECTLVAHSGVKRKIAVNPAAALTAAQTDYTVHITTAVRNIGGNAVPTEIVVQVTTP
jgi:hypothetical protein